MMDRNGAAPLVSIIMPAYNAQDYIGEAIRSVQDQTVTDWQLFVIDDGSKDGTCRIVAELAQMDSRIHLLPNEKNMGTARTRNRGLELCRSRYVAFLDSDDIWYPQKLERQLAAAEEKKADVVFTSYAIIDNAGKNRCNDFIVQETVDLKGMLRRNELGCSTVLLSERVARQYRFLEEFYHEDYALWLKMLRDGAVFAGVTEVLVGYRYHSNSRASNKLNSARSRWRIYRELLGMSVFTSGWYLMQYGFNGVWKYRHK